jgi:hypothetical protein
MTAHKVKRWYLETCHLTARRKVAVTSIIDYLLLGMAGSFCSGRLSLERSHEV